ncbi:integrase, catalytic region [Rhodovulum sulfidophilum]|uniref:Integrase, catalytic region n=1 Tax=Rhodovulum sulfidophilum TaxID=35806 RepID=A0A0D6B0B9_RHOSU|nr:integrase, catalytic region [Rhodovulum sulfidophilum]
MQHKPPRVREDESWLTGDFIELAREYGCYGDRGNAVLLRRAGWQTKGGPHLAARGARGSE